MQNQTRNAYTDSNRKEEWRPGWRGPVDLVVGPIVSSKGNGTPNIFVTLEEAQLEAEALPREVECVMVVREPYDGGWCYTVRGKSLEEGSRRQTWIWDRPPIGWSGPHPNMYICGFPKLADGKGRAKYDTLQEAVEAAEKYGPQLIAGITQDHYGSRKFTLRAGKLWAQTDTRKKETVSWVYVFQPSSSALANTDRMAVLEDVMVKMNDCYKSNI